MSIYLPEIFNISKSYANNLQAHLQKAFDAFDKFEEDYKNGRFRGRETIKNKNPLGSLQSINEDEVANALGPTMEPVVAPVRSTRVSRKRSKDEGDGTSPEPEKRAKRSASTKAQNCISKQVNMNLTKKMRREEEPEAEKKRESRSRTKRGKTDDKENAHPLPLPIIDIKQEKISLPPPEPMEEDITPNVVVKNEVTQEDNCMPPPIAPPLKPRKAREKAETSILKDTDLERRSTRNRKQTDAMPPPGRPKRGTSSTSISEDQPPSPEPRPKRTRAKKKAEPPEPSKVDEDKPSADNTSQETTALPTSRQKCVTSSTSLDEDQPPSPEPRPKQTRGKKKAEPSEPSKEVDEDKTSEETIAVPTSTPPQEKTRPKRTRKVPPKLKDTTTEKKNSTEKTNSTEKKSTEKTKSPSKVIDQSQATNRTSLRRNSQSQPADMSLSNTDGQSQSPILQSKAGLTKTKSIEKRVVKTERGIEVSAVVNEKTIVNGLNETMVLPNGVYDHAPYTPKAINMNETVILERAARSTLILEKPNSGNQTIVLSKDKRSSNMTNDDSIMTEDNSDVIQTPPKSTTPKQNPPSAVKEKVQQFEEIASRVTRTKTRAMVKKAEETDTQTPPDKVLVPPKSVLSADTLSKMNNLIFSQKPQQISSSASKSIPVLIQNAKMTSSTTKVNAINKLKEREEEMKREKEDARKKKEALLEAKKEQQKRKREEKMQAAAAAREAAEREREKQLETLSRERKERQASADQGRLHRLKEQEKKKQELARKVLETEERRKAEEQARANRLAEEQKRAEAQRLRQLHEQEAMKKETAKMAKDFEKRQKEYIEKQKLKQKLESDKVTTPLRLNLSITRQPVSPVYMEDGFQYLNSDSENEHKSIPVPHWSQSKVRWKQLSIQANVRSSHVDRLFSVRTHSPNLQELFPGIDRRVLKRTSSAVWRSPRTADK